MLNWFEELDMFAQLLVAAGAGVLVGIVFSLFGDIVDFEDIV